MFSNVTVFEVFSTGSVIYAGYSGIKAYKVGRAEKWWI